MKGNKTIHLLLCCRGLSQNVILHYLQLLTYWTVVGVHIWKVREALLKVWKDLSMVYVLLRAALQTPSVLQLRSVSN